MTPPDDDAVTRPLVVIANWRDRRHPRAGGAENVCQHLALGLTDAGYRVVLLAAAVEGAPRQELADGYAVVRRGGRFTVYPWALLWLWRRRRRVAAVIDSQNGIPFFSPLVVPRRTPVLMLLHHVHQEQFALYFSPAAARLGQWLERVGSRLVYRDRAVLVVSPSTRDDARGSLGLRGDLVVVPPGCDAAPPRAGGIRDRAVAPRLVCVGRLVPHKHTDKVVRATAELLGQFPDLTLDLVGDGSQRHALEELVRRLDVGDSVTVHGRLPDAERDRLLRTAWLSVNASEGEGWGLSVIEANASGVPVLAYRRPGLTDSIRDHETGWLIDEGTPLAVAIATALDQLADEREAEAMAERARRWAAVFTWDEMSRRVVAQLEAEAGRLARRGRDRRAVNDEATVVRIPGDLLAGAPPLAFRRTDLSARCGGDLVVLLRDAGLAEAPEALRRVGLGQAVVGLVGHPRVRLAPARPLDLVSPALGEIKQENSC